MTESEQLEDKDGVITSSSGSLPASPGRPS
jgi:hypothetical protein